MSYKGISYHKQSKKYRSEVYHKGIRYNCGEYLTDVEAVKARDLMIIRKNLDLPLQKLRKL
jgi:hypothetical protein